MTQDYRVVVSHGPAAGVPEQEVVAASARALGELIGALPLDGSVRVERIADSARYAIACPLPGGACFVMHDDGQGRSGDTERGSSAEAGQALHAWAVRANAWEWAFSWMQRFPVPQRIPIAHEPGFRTDLAGSWDGGQFLAGFYDVTYLHLFDRDGRHLRSRIGVAEEEAGQEDTDAAMARLRELVDELPGRRFGDIAVRPFSVEHGGHSWGLFDKTEAYGFPHAELEPDMLGFGAPWNGLYDT
ncbi:hypothetical protein [Kitasatospora sp. NPDC057936]|uniref:hypothetical protein n=1 Tax=Kitasatospora sp. NPDC057936 TaxID=3346283 RepID=UPI0036DF1E13